jgi:hypothetical protein
MNSHEDHENDSVGSRTGLRALIGVIAALAAFITIGLFMWWNWKPPLFPHLDSIQEMTLISVDGTYDQPWHKPESIPSGESFYRFPVFGEVEIADPNDRQAIISAIQQAVREAEGDEMAKCFYPRHGLRITTKEAIYEYNICFECAHLYKYVNSEKQLLTTTSQSPQKFLNTFFEKAGIPLAPYPPKLTSSGETE